MLGTSGGFLAILALAAFLPIALFVGRRTPRALAIALIVVGGTIVLPEGAVLLDLPIVPAIDKDRVVYLSALIAALAFFRRDFVAAKPGLGLELLFPLVFICYLVTTSQNRLPVTNYGTLYDGLGIYWILARSIDDILTFFLPFVIGRTMIRGASDLRTLGYVLVGAGVVYVPIIASEALLSIPFHVWQWHYFFYDIALRASWRWGGIQPIAFMEDPLANASFMAITVIFAAAFAAAKTDSSWFGLRRAHLATQLGLLMTRVTSSNVYGIVFGFALRVLSVRISSLLALCAAAGVCIYPALRLAELFPYQNMVEFVRENLNEERARSFEGRFLEENFVFEGLGDRLWFGWGMYDRIPGAATFGEGETGLDSFLVIRVGLTGIVGTELIFFLMLIPVIVAWRRVSRLPQREAQLLMVALMLCVAARMVDTLLNDIWTSLPFFLAGALLGVARSVDAPPQTSPAASGGNGRVRRRPIARPGSRVRRGSRQ